MNDLKFALRQLLKNAGFTAVAVSSLAVGLALAATALSLVNAYLLCSLPYPTAKRVYHVRYAPPGPYEPQGMTAIDWASLQDVVEDTITPAGATFYVMNHGSVTTFRGLRVPSGFIRGLGVQPMMGRAFTPDEYAEGGEAVALIGHQVWRDRFGSDPQILGRTFRLNRDELAEQGDMLRIVGVLPAWFWYGRDSRETVDVITPLTTRVRNYMIRLREDVPVAYAERRITEAARAVGSDFRPDWAGVQLESVHDRYVAEVRPVLLGISAAVGFVLVLICANVGVLTLLRAMRRQKEMSVRVALGAGRTQILRIFVIEALLLCGAALAVGAGLAGMTLRLITPMVETQLGKPSPAGPSVIELDFTVFSMLGTVSLFIALALALLPWMTPDRHRLAEALRSSGTASTDGPFMRRLRSLLIGFQIAGSVVLLVGCGLMVRSVVNVMNTDLGFNPRQVVRVGIRLPARTYADTSNLLRFYGALLEQLPRDPSSEAALMSAFPSFYPANPAAFEADGRVTEESTAGVMRVGAGYFSLYQVKLAAGREFRPSDRPGAEPVAMISETLARKLWPEENAVGRRIRVVEGDMAGSGLGSWRTIVGVAGDIRQGYDDADLKDIYLPFLQAPGRFASIHLRTDRTVAFWEQSVRRTVARIDPYVQINVAKTIVSEDRQGAGMRFLTSLLSGFSILATLLAVLGIYGVTAYVVQQRQREIAIRVALGASQASIVRLFLKEGIRTLVFGLGFGVIGTVGVAGILQNRVYGVQPFDPVTLLSAFSLMALIGLLAIWWPARLGTQRDPLSALKES